MEIHEMDNYLSKLYLSARKQDGSHYKKTSLLSIRTALDRYLRSSPPNKKFSICDGIQFNEGNKTFNSHLKHLSSAGKIAGTIHKSPLTAEFIQKLFEAAEVASGDGENSSRFAANSMVLCITSYISVKETERSLMKKSMLRLAVTASGEEYFELNKEKPGAVLSTKNHTGGR